MRLVLPACALLALAMANAPVARAAESYDNCTGFVTSLPAVISVQGTWCLNADLATSLTAGNAIQINTNNVTLDCNHFKVGGLGGGTATLATGVRAQDRLNITIRKCNIRGFHYGIRLAGGGGHVVEDNAMDRNRFASISIDGDGSVIRRNLVVDGGASTSAAGAAFGIETTGTMDIVDNVINGVQTLNLTGSATGIYTFQNTNGNISGNMVRNLAAVEAENIRGIRTISSGRVVIQGNIIQNDGTRRGEGIRCGANTATARSNVVAGFTDGIINCSQSGNLVNLL